MTVSKGGYIFKNGFPYNCFDVAAIYYPNSQLVVDTSVDDIGKEFDIITIDIQPGQNTVLYVIGYAGLHMWGGTQKMLGIFMEIDTNIDYESLQLALHETKSIYYLRETRDGYSGYGFYNEYSGEITGDATITMINNDRLEGKIVFRCETQGAIFSRNCEIDDIPGTDHVEGDIQFKAIKGDKKDRPTFPAVYIHEYKSQNN